MPLRHELAVEVHPTSAAEVHPTSAAAERVAVITGHEAGHTA